MEAAMANNTQHNARKRSLASECPEEDRRPAQHERAKRRCSFSSRASVRHECTIETHEEADGEKGDEAVKKAPSTTRAAHYEDYELEAKENDGPELLARLYSLRFL